MSILSSMYNYISEQAYYIGFLLPNEMNLPEEERFKSIHWLNLNGYKSGWFADPFFLSVSDRHIELFVEEWEYAKGKGRLCLLDIKRTDNDFILENIAPVLDIDTHLSFPITIEENNKIYVYPENYESGTLKIYEYDSKERRLKKPHTIIELPLLDTQIVKNGNFYYAMGVEYKTGQHADTKRLQIFKSENLLGPYKHMQDINNNLCEERGAGKIFTNNNAIIRPTQCCEGDYGRAVIFKVVDFYSDNALIQEEIGRVYPVCHKKYGMGIHTYNMMSGLCVIDGRDYRHRTLSRLVRFFLRK